MLWSRIWEKMNQGIIHCLTRSVPRCLKCMEAHWGCKHYWARLVWSLWFKFITFLVWFDDFGFHWLLLHNFVLSKLQCVSVKTFSLNVLSSRTNVWFKCSCNFFYCILFFWSGVFRFFFFFVLRLLKTFLCVCSDWAGLCFLIWTDGGDNVP